MPDAPAIVFEDARIGVRFSVDARFVPGPPTRSSPGLGLDHVRTAYLAWDDRGAGNQYVLSVSAVPVPYTMTRAELEHRLPVSNESGARLAAERGWLLFEPATIHTFGGELATFNEFITPGTHPDDKVTDDPDEDASGHVQSATMFMPRRVTSLMLGVHPPGNPDIAREIMRRVLDSVAFFPPAE